MSAGEYQRYRFGPLERRGLIGSLRPAQVIVIAASLTGGVILMRALSSGAGVVAALALALLAVAFCFWPISGRSAEAWLPVVGRHAARHALGTSRPALARPAAPEHDSTADGRPEPIAALPEVGARPRAARGAVPRRDGRRAQGPARTLVHGGAGGAG